MDTTDFKRGPWINFLVTPDGNLIRMRVTGGHKTLVQLTYRNAPQSTYLSNAPTAQISILNKKPEDWNVSTLDALFRQMVPLILEMKESISEFKDFHSVVDSLVEAAKLKKKQKELECSGSMGNELNSHEYPSRPYTRSQSALYHERSYQVKPYN